MEMDGVLAEHIAEILDRWFVCSAWSLEHIRHSLDGWNVSPASLTVVIFAVHFGRNSSRSEAVVPKSMSAMYVSENPSAIEG